MRNFGSKTENQHPKPALQEKKIYRIGEKNEEISDFSAG